MDRQSVSRASALPQPVLRAGAGSRRVAAPDPSVHRNPAGALAAQSAAAARPRPLKQQPDAGY